MTAPVDTLTTNKAEARQSHAGVAVPLAAIWLSTAVISIFAPDMVTGAQQEHLPIAALTAWLWAGSASAYVIVGGALAGRGGAWSGPRWYDTSVATLWGVVALASVFGPTLVTGTDPTRIPLVALVAPIVGALTTGLLALLAAGRR